MGLKNFSIVLDSPTGAYYAGTNVTGRVLLSLQNPKKVRALNIKIDGEATVKWEESETVKKNDGDTTTEYVNYTSSEVYFSNKFKLLGSGSGEHEIPAGDHVYPFASTLPPLLPSSFEGEHGSVRYTIKATLDRPWKFDHDVTVPFKVVTPIDLNFNNKAKEAVKEESEKSFCCLCCKSGPLQLVVCIPQTGYVAGQPIPLTIEVDNASNVEVNSVVCKLDKELKYTAQNPSYKVKTTNVELSKLSLEGVSTNGSKSWTQKISVPEMPFVNLDACSIINITYELVVEACVGALHANLRICIPIIIGSVPIYQNNGPNPTPAPNFEPGGVSYPTLPSEAIEPSAPLLTGAPPNPGVIGFAVLPGNVN